MFGQRHRHWPNIETVLGECLMFAGRWEDCIIFLQICRNTMQSSHLPRKHEVEHVSVSTQIQSYYYVFILPPFSVYVKSATSSSWGISFFFKGQANTYTRHSTNAVSMLCQRRRGWTIIDKLTASTCVCWVHGQRLRLSGRCWCQNFAALGEGLSN